MMSSRDNGTYSILQKLFKKMHVNVLAGNWRKTSVSPITSKV